MKCNWCKIQVDEFMIYCEKTHKFYCSEECKEKDLKEYVSFVELPEESCSFIFFYGIRIPNAPIQATEDPGGNL